MKFCYPAADMRWDAASESLNDGANRRVTLRRDGRAASYCEAIQAWRSDRAFREITIELLAAAPYQAYFWETPPLSRATRSRGFEFVLADSPALAALRPDPQAFARHFETLGAEAQTAAFWNLGGDARLVAPCPRAPDDAYPHLAAFARKAPREQQHAFWSQVGESVAESLSESPLWLSTSGLGVAWLHVRLDSRPKYYTFQPYRRMA